MNIANSNGQPPFIGFRSRMKIEGIDSLKFEDQHFNWQGRSYAYYEVKSVSFIAIATKNSVNGIPTGTTYEADLRIHLNDEILPIIPIKNWVGNLKKNGMEALQKAAAIFGELTFNNRIEGYERQVRERGFFSFADIQFHRTGDVFRHGERVCDIHDTAVRSIMEPFKLTIGKKEKTLGERIRSVFSPSDIVLDLTRDRDCLLFMLKSLYGLEWQGSPVREKRVDRHKLFYETIIRFGAMLSMVDGQADPNELAQLKTFFNIDQNTMPEAARIFNEELLSSSSLSDVLGFFGKEFSDAEELKEGFLVGMISVALADGKFDPREFSLIEQASAYLRIGDASFVRAFMAAGIDLDQLYGKTKSRGSSSNTSQGRSSWTSPFKVLGLEEGAGRDNIVKAYRALVRRHHPDVLRGQGMPEAEIEKANAVLVQINLAYQYLIERA